LRSDDQKKKAHLPLNFFLTRADTLCDTVTTPNGVGPDGTLKEGRMPTDATLAIIFAALAPKTPTAAEIAADAYGERLAEMAIAAGYGSHQKAE
jgi:hypothetical protein